MSTDGGGGGGKKAGRPLAITSAVKETETKRERESQNGWGWRLSGNKFQVISMGQDGRFLWLSSSYVLRLGRTSFSSNLLLSLLFGFLSASRRVLQYILLCQHQSPNTDPPRPSSFFCFLSHWAGTRLSHAPIASPKKQPVRFPRAKDDQPTPKKIAQDK